MSTDFMTRLMDLTDMSFNLDRLEAITRSDRITYPYDQLLQLEADRTMRDIEKTRKKIYVKQKQLYEIAKMN